MFYSIISMADFHFSSATDSLATSAKKEEAKEREQEDERESDRNKKKIRLFNRKRILLQMHTKTIARFHLLQ